MKWILWATLSGCSAMLLIGCGPSEKQKMVIAEQKRIECLDKLCKGDVPPARDHLTQEVLKLNGQWFIGPKEYFTIGMNGGAFYWPSKTPMSGRPDGQLYPERGKSYSDNAIEIFLRSNNIPPEPRGYKLIEQAERKGWIAERKTLRAGLDEVRMKHVIGPTGYAVDQVTYYVATDLKGLDGLPPVATCNHDQPSNSGGTGFIWKPGIWLGTRWNQKQCADWPEIYQDVMRVMSLIKEA